LRVKQRRYDALALTESQVRPCLVPRLELLAAPPGTSDGGISSYAKADLLSYHGRLGFSLLPDRKATTGSLLACEKLSRIASFFTEPDRE
ncbi:hypothetical protein CSUI_005281, partial [Cystoisospora suis]